MQQISKNKHAGPQGQPNWQVGMLPTLLACFQILGHSTWIGPAQVPGVYPQGIPRHRKKHSGTIYISEILKAIGDESQRRQSKRKQQHQSLLMSHIIVEKTNTYTKLFYKPKNKELKNGMILYLLSLKVGVQLQKK